MRHLIIGASGQIGEQLSQKLLRSREEVIGTYFSTSLFGTNNSQGFTSQIPAGKNFILDIRKANDVKRLIDDVKPQFVYLPAAATNVDYCQQNPQISQEVNVGGVKNVVDALKTFSQPPLLVFFSTDYLFDGISGPYLETDLPNPICEYGRQKLMAEHYIGTHSERFLIIRTNWVFGNETQGKNFVQRLVQNLRDGNTAQIPADEFGTPTSAQDLVSLTLHLAPEVLYRSCLVNIAGSDFVSKYEFARQAAIIFELDPALISPIESFQLSRPAPRPLRGGLVVDKISDMVRKPIGYLEALARMKHSATT